MSVQSITTVSNCTVGTGTGQCSACNPPRGCGLGYDCTYDANSCSTSFCCSII